MIVLAMGLYRAGVAGFACLAIAAGPVVFAVGAQSEHVMLMLPGAGMMTAGLGSVGLRVIKSPAEQGTLTPGAVRRA
jgi:hypothetical protein